MRKRKRFFPAWMGIPGLLMLALVTPVGPAQASRQARPSVEALLKRCQAGHKARKKAGGDACVFHPRSRIVFFGPRRQVGAVAYNCTDSEQEHSISWEDTTGGSHTAKLGLTLELDFARILTAAVQTKYNRTWEWSRSVRETDKVTVPSRSMGWIVRATQLHTVTGRWTVRLSRPYMGHRVWQIHNYRATAPVPGRKGHVIFHSRDMSAQELRSICGIEPDEQNEQNEADD